MILQGDVVVTGGAGYVGSHVLVELLEGGFDGVIVIDRLNEAKRGKNLSMLSLLNLTLLNFETRSFMVSNL